MIRAKETRAVKERASRCWLTYNEWTDLQGRKPRLAARLKPVLLNFTSIDGLLHMDDLVEPDGANRQQRAQVFAMAKSQDLTHSVVRVPDAILPHMAGRFALLPNLDTGSG